MWFPCAVFTEHSDTAAGPGFPQIVGVSPKQSVARAGGAVGASAVLLLFEAGSSQRTWGSVLCSGTGTCVAIHCPPILLSGRRTDTGDAMKAFQERRAVSAPSHNPKAGAGVLLGCGQRGRWCPRGSFRDSSLGGGAGGFSHLPQRREQGCCLALL